MGARYSHSRIGLYRTCPCKYKYKYISREQVPRRISADLFMGSAVHEALRRLYDLVSDNVVMSVEDLIKSYHAEWEKPDRQYIEVFRDHLTIEDYIANGEKMLRRHYDSYHPFDQGHILGVEETFNFTLPGTPFQFTARIDRLWKNTDGTVEVTDFKTGRRLPHGPRDRFFFNQMALYQLAVQASHPQFETIVVAQYFLRHNEVISCEISEEDLDSFTEGIRQEVLQIERSVATGDFPTTEGGHCNYCEFAMICPARRHRYILDNEEGADAEELATAENAALLAEKYIEIDVRSKEVKTKLAALKEDLIRIAGDLGFDKLTARSGVVSIKTTTDPSFVTKTEDFNKFLQLSDLLRKWDMAECLTIDRTALKKMYKKSQFSAEQIELLEPFVADKQSTRVSVRMKKAEADAVPDE